LIGTLRDEQIARLKAHVAAEEKARDAQENALSIRLGGEFHVALAKMTNSAFLLRYTRELTSRCSLMLALYSRPVSAECGVAEHRCIVDHIAAGERDQVVDVMERHLTAVVDRALIKPRQPPQRSIFDVLSQYLDSAEP
jgi:DNA-binding GntR family transcriptional regulator